MRKVLAFVVGLFLTCGAAQADVWQAEYGVARTFDFTLFNADGTLDVDEVDGGTEVTLDCNGTPATATNDFADEGSFYSIALTAAELQCERVTVTVAATLTSVFHIETFGHASGFNETLGWLTGDAFARLGAPAGASVSADIAAVEGQTDDIGVAGAGLTAADDAVITVLGTPAGASVSADIAAVEGQTDDIGVAGAGLTAADDAVVALIGTPSNFGSGTSTLAANLQDIADDGTAVFDRSTDSLQAIRDRGDAAWVTGGGGACTADVGCIADGTAAGVTATTIDLAAGETFADNELSGGTVVIASATAGTGQSRLILSNTAANDRLTVDTWTTTPTGTVTYRVFATPPGSTTSPSPVNVLQVEGTDATNVLGTAQTGDAFARLGAPAGASVSADIAAIEGQTDDIGVAGAGLTAADDAVIAVLGTPAGASVSADIAVVEGQTDDIGVAGAGLTALASQTSVTTIDDFLDTEITALMNARTQIFPGNVDADSVLTADSGDTNTLVDTELTFAAAQDIDGAYVVREDGQRCEIDSFTPATDTLEFGACTFTGAWSTQTYKIYPANTQ